MKTTRITLVAILIGLIVFFYAIFADAVTITRGYLLKATSTTIKVAVPHGGQTRVFGYGRSTRVSSNDGPMQIQKIPRNSVVEIVDKNGYAVTVIVVEVPR